MTPTKQSSEWPTEPQHTDERSSVLHLATPRSKGLPRCGETSPDAVIGIYGERLDGERWVREVFGKDGKAGTPCETCLARYPPTLYRNSSRNEDGWPLFIMLAKWHLVVPIAVFLIWLLWKLCQWIATAPHPPRVP